MTFRKHVCVARLSSVVVLAASRYNVTSLFSGVIGRSSGATTLSCGVSDTGYATTKEANNVKIPGIAFSNEYICLD